MRTTIEISPEHRARLVELAARRGDKGFSRLIAEALDIYLQEREKDEARVRAALAAAGSLAEADAAELRTVTQGLRDSWR